MSAMNNRRAVPFEIPEINHGLKEAKGLMKPWKRGLELEFEVQDGLIGIFKSGVTTVHIAFEDLNEISYKKGWFSDKVIMEGVSMRVFEDIPGTDVATCTLKVRRKNRNEAQQLISSLRVRFSEYKLQQMEGEGEGEG